MSITFIKQDLTTSDADYICHQVNCQGKMNSGVAKAIREKWPIVFGQYKNKCLHELLYHKDLLGEIQIVKVEDNLNIINMFAQFDYGYDGKRYTLYDAFDRCLQTIKIYTPVGSKIAFPYKIGCDRGGACWDVIFEMIKHQLKNYDIIFYYLTPDQWLKDNVVDIEWRNK